LRHVAQDLRNLSLFFTRGNGMKIMDYIYMKMYIDGTRKYNYWYYNIIFTMGDRADAILRPFRACFSLSHKPSLTLFFPDFVKFLSNNFNNISPGIFLQGLVKENCIMGK
jgi:hypothetical protein